MSRGSGRARYRKTGPETWRTWVSLNGVHHLVLNSINHCATCGARDHKGKKEIRNASPA